jgi:DinB family protein
MYHDAGYNRAVTLNPYASFLGNKNPADVLEQTARQLAKVGERLATNMEWRPSPGKWNAREILCHLADCEIAFGFRLRQTLAETHHVIQPFDQEKWAGMYGGLSARSAISTFSALREWNLALIGSTTEEGMAKTVNHPERGDMTFRTIVETMAGHDINHLNQLDAIVAGFAR